MKPFNPHIEFYLNFWNKKFSHILQGFLAKKLDSPELKKIIKPIKIPASITVKFIEIEPQDKKPFISKDIQ